MTDMTFPAVEVQSQHVDLRVGLPYAGKESIAVSGGVHGFFLGIS